MEIKNITQNGKNIQIEDDHIIIDGSVHKIPNKVLNAPKSKHIIDGVIYLNGFVFDETKKKWKPEIQKAKKFNWFFGKLFRK